MDGRGGSSAVSPNREPDRHRNQCFESLFRNFVAQSHAGETFLGNASAENHLENFTEDIVDFVLRYRTILLAFKSTRPRDEAGHGFEK